MTREKALKVSDLLFKIERYEALIEEILILESFEELAEVYSETMLADEVVRPIRDRVDKLLKELEEM
jgi:hypothetical protein